MGVCDDQFIVCICIHFIAYRWNAINMVQVDTEVSMKKETEEERKKRIEELARHMHPHDDEPDPTAYMGNYNFPQMLFAFCLGFVTMFVLSVNEINEFKGCPLPEYFQKEVKG